MKNNPSIPSVPTATPEDIQSITEVSRDYAEGWFTADEKRMRRALHPELAKRTVRHHLQADTWKLGNTLTAEAMVGYTHDMVAEVAYRSLKKLMRSLSLMFSVTSQR